MGTAATAAAIAWGLARSMLFAASVLAVGTTTLTVIAWRPHSRAAGQQTDGGSRSIGRRPSVRREAGFERGRGVDLTSIRGVSRADDAAPTNVSAREAPSIGPNGALFSETVEEGLAKALVLAAQAGQWAVVAQLARELESRRLAAARIPSLATARRESER